MLFREIKFKKKNIPKEDIGKIVGVLRFREGYYNYWQVFFKGEEADYYLSMEEQCLTKDEIEDYKRTEISNN